MSIIKFINFVIVIYDMYDRVNSFSDAILFFREKTIKQSQITL